MMPIRNFVNPIFLLTLLFQLPYICDAQQWQFRKTENPFDGTQHIAFVQGKGSDFPYVSPILSVTISKYTSLANISIQNAGFTGCDNKIVRVTFDHCDTLFNFLNLERNSEDIWHLTDELGEMKVEAILELMLRKNQMHVQTSSDCSTNDMQFTLNGSTWAINQVLPEHYIENTRKRKLADLNEQLNKEKYVRLLRKGDVQYQLENYDSAISIYKKAGELSLTDSLHLKKIRVSVKMKESVKESNPLVKEEDQAKTRSLLVIKGTVIRAEPDISGEVLSYIEKGQLLQIVDYPEFGVDFIKVTYGDIEGFVALDTVQYR